MDVGDTIIMRGTIKKLGSVMLVLCSFLYACGLSVSLETARETVESAKSAIRDAKMSKVDVYAPKEIKSAERLLRSAEQALANNHRQRAYILAQKAIKTIEEAKASIGGDKLTLTGEQMPQKVPTVEGPQVGVEPSPIPSEVVVPKGAIIQEPFEKHPKEVFPSIQPYVSSATEFQDRIEAATQALDSAQKAVQSAWTLLFRLKVDIELSKMDANIKMLQDMNVPNESIELVKSWYLQAQRSAASGNYELSMKFLQRIQMYVQILTTPVQ